MPKHGKIPKDQKRTYLTGFKRGKKEGVKQATPKKKKKK